MSASGPGDDDPGERRGEEPRVRDLLARPAGEQAGTPLDAETIAQIAHWFGLPSFADVEEGGGAPAAPEMSIEDEKIAARVAQQRQALEAIDPSLVDYVGRHGRRPITRPVALPRRPWLDDKPVILFDETQIPPEVDYRDPGRDMPWELRRLLQTCTPQAFLRDLHRPEKDFYVQYRSPWIDEPWFHDAPPVADPVAPIREVMRKPVTGQATYAPAPATMTAASGQLREILRRPWADAKRERARQREAELLAAEAEARAQQQRKTATPGTVGRKPEDVP